jgi:PST family polysaccharide transporter
MAGLFFWQLVGDFLKIASWLIAYLMHAKAMTKLFIITEIIFSGLYIWLAMFLSSVIGLIGIVFGYAVNYLIYSIVIYFFVYQNIEKNQNE